MHLTPRKKKILAFINRYAERHDFAPSIPEIAEHFSLAISTIHQHLEELKTGGYLKKERNRPRGIEIDTSESMVHVPLLGIIAAGDPLHIFEESREWVAVPKKSLPKQASLFALHVKGDSMVDEGINDGDIILVKQQITAENGEKVVAVIDKEEATVKKIYKQKQKIKLQPANKNYQPLFFSANRVEVKGVVVDVLKNRTKLPLRSTNSTKEPISLNIAPLKSVSNPNSMHGIYPYRGKISAIDASSIVRQLKSGVLLDPFCGSGTILYEANLAGLDTIGVDNNPLAIWIAQGKLAALKADGEQSINEVKKLIKNAQKRKKREELSSHANKAFHEETAYEIISLIKEFNTMSDYVRACFLGTIALAARGCNHYKWTSSSVGKDIQPKQYINFYEKFINKVNKHNYDFKSDKINEIYLHDSRRLSEIIKEQSVDYVFTSPPYFNALDYTAYYARIIYNLLGCDHLEIKRGLIQTVNSYAEDMRHVLNEIIKITKKDGLIIFVVGDKKIKNQIVSGGLFFSKLLNHKPNVIIERNYTGSSSQVFDNLNKTERKEQIVVWDKSTW